MKKTGFIFSMAVIVTAALLCINKINIKIQDEKQSEFNYPYIVYSKNQEHLQEYNVWFPNMVNLTWATQEFITPDENMITYQQAANIAANALENIYGLTELSHQNGVIQLYNHVVYNSLQPDVELNPYTSDIAYNQPHHYVYMFISADGVRYYASVDRYNGMVFNIGNNTSFVAGQADSTTSQQSQEVLSLLEEYISYLNITAEITDTDITHYVNISGLNYYNIYANLSDGFNAKAVIYKPYGEDYQLMHFSVRQPVEY